MARTILKATKRTTSGSGSCNKLKQNKQVPAILYGAHIESQSLTLQESDLNAFLSHNHVGVSLDLELDGEKQFVMLKDIQRDPISRKVIHADFQAIKLGEELKLTIPVFVQGKDELRDLICQELISELEISCLPKHLIDHIDIDVSNMKADDQILVSDLKEFADPNINILSDENNIICLVSEKEVFAEEEASEYEENIEPELVSDSEDE